mgnify:CR=1 FL=1
MEILSPASNMNHITVAIDGKANAVYGGLKKWNARNKAINFTTEEYNVLIEKLHKNNIKFFLTLNILMLDDEIKEVIDFLKQNTLPDAFIVTDIGLVQELHKEFPNVPLHFSTQFGAHNIDDVNYIKSLDGERAILSRELTLPEINNIKENTDIELECFIWGSQCLSFSGLCFFGTLINGGGGNRGKCIITCRDIYSINSNKGHHLYVPDMNCIDLKSKLDGIDCLKLEGRRRNPQEIKEILEKINNNIFDSKSVGYLLGTSIKDNNLYEKINTRTKPFMKASDLENIKENDICLKYENNIPISFSQDYSDDNVMYIYTELKKSYNINKKNISLDLIIENNLIKEILYMNYRGDGKTFFGNDKNLIEIDFNKLINLIEKNNSNINVYKIKYQRTDDKKIYINSDIYDGLIKYILKDCENRQYKIINNKLKLNTLYLDTMDLNVIDKFINDDFVKIIYDISTINNLKQIEKVISKYGNKIIYKLPVFNWKSENLMPYLSLLENKEIMFTRFTQLYLCKDIIFKKKYVDYTIYVWNKKTLNYLKDYGIQEFTISPELSYETNKKIFGNNNMQVIIGGKLPLVYTRNCFSHLFGCGNCKNNQCNKKNIKNDDKNLDFEILCNDDYRYILNSNPTLNDYSKINITQNTTFRYSTLGQSIELIEKSINCFKKENYYKELKNISFWENSYECNLLEGKE